MKKKGFSEFIKDYRVMLFIIVFIGSLIAIPTLGIQQGLDLKGGSLIQLELDEPVDAETMNTVTSVLDRRLNIFGVMDVVVRPSGNQNVLIEIAGVQPDEVSEIVGSPGKFEAKIGNETALRGTEIVSVQPYQITATQWSVPFRISTEGAREFADVAEGQAGQPVDMYLDGELISSPELDEGLATGIPSTEVQITGTEPTREEAEITAREIQTVLQSGALPVGVSIVGINSVTADLGENFVEGSLIAALMAVIGTSAIIFLKYRNPIIVIPIIFTVLSEILIILGVASIIQWNMDLAAIAGIIAAVGTGVDDQIIITDEVLKGGPQKKRRRASMRMKIKSAFFIIFAAAATLFAAMLPLAYVGFSRGYTGIGVLSGFAFTTIIGVLIGIFITRPVYAKLIEKIVDRQANK